MCLIVIGRHKVGERGLDMSQSASQANWVVVQTYANKY